MTSNGLENTGETHMAESPPPTIHLQHPRTLLGRDAILALLENQLRTRTRNVLGVDPAITNGRGVGRTRILDELEQRLSRSQTVLRLSASGPVAWDHSLSRVTQHLEITDSSGQRHSHQVHALRQWLHTHEDWVLIVDSLDEWEPLIELTQGITSGSCLVAVNDGRIESPEGWPAAIPLGALAAEDALALLKNVLQRDWHNPEERLAAIQLVQWLEYVPRLIERAGTTIRIGQLNCETGLTLLQQMPDHSPSGKTLRGILMALEKHAPKAMELLATAAMFGTLPITQLWIAHWMRQLACDRGDDSHSLLKSSGLLEFHAGRDEITVAARREVGEILSPDIFRRSALRALEVLPPATDKRRLTALITGIPEGTTDPWSHYRIALGEAIERFTPFDAEQTQWMRQASEAALDLSLYTLAQRLLLTLLSQQLQASFPESILRTTLVQLGLAYLQGEQFQQARCRLRQALEFCHGEDPLNTELLLAIAEIDINENRMDRAATRLADVPSLANGYTLPHGPLYIARQRFLLGGIALGTQDASEARQHFQDSMEIRTGYLPVDHPDMMKTRLMLARTEFMLKNYAASEGLLRAEVDIRKQSPNASPSDVGVALNFLGELYYLLGRHQDAEPVYEHSLALRRLIHPSGHRLIGEMADRLAVIKSSRGAYRESDDLFREAITILEGAYGPDHPEVARALTDLAESLFAQHKVDPARRLLERSLNIQERSLRSNDPRLARTCCNLAAVYVARGRFTDAIRLYERDIQQREGAQRTDKSALATSLNNLAEALRSVGRYDEAEQRLNLALTLREQTVGQEHPQTAQILGNLGFLNYQRHRYAEARDYLERSLRIRQKMLGPQNPQVAISLVALGDTLFACQQYSEARPLLQQGLEILLAAYGDRHPQCISAQISTARNELRLGHVGRSELMLLRARTMLQELLGQDHRLSAKALLALAELAHFEKRYDDAFPMLERCLAIQKGTSSVDHLDMTETLVTIATNLIARKLHAEALPRVLQALEIQHQVLGPSHPEMLPHQLLVGQIQQELGNTPAAEEALLAVLQTSDSPSTHEIHNTAESLLIDVLIRRQKYDAAAHRLQHQLAQAQTRDDPTTTLRLSCQLASLHYLQSGYEQARSLMQNCVTLSEQLHGPGHIETAKHLDNLAGVHFLLSDHDSAEKAVLQSIAILEKNPTPQARDPLTKARSNYAELLRRTHRLDEAQQLDERVRTTNTVITGQIAQSHVLDDLF